MEQSKLTQLAILSVTLLSVASCKPGVTETSTPDTPRICGFHLRTNDLSDYLESKGAKLIHGETIMLNDQSSLDVLNYSPDMVINSEFIKNYYLFLDSILEDIQGNFFYQDLQVEAGKNFGTNSDFNLIQERVNLPDSKMVVISSIPDLALERCYADDVSGYTTDVVNSNSEDKTRMSFVLASNSKASVYTLATELCQQFFDPIQWLPSAENPETTGLQEGVCNSLGLAVTLIDINSESGSSEGKEEIYARYLNEVEKWYVRNNTGETYLTPAITKKGFFALVDLMAVFKSPLKLIENQ
ncbi:hypothetical protein JW796_03820 [Candidatus Dojkabacteria bacterium]|nr:hypothetical protein [Candidatus Dojkabacteria bacterium]